MQDHEQAEVPYVEQTCSTLLFLVVAGRVECNAPGGKVSRFVKMKGLFLVHFLIIIIVIIIIIIIIIITIMIIIWLFSKICNLTPPPYLLPSIRHKRVHETNFCNITFEMRYLQ